MSQTHSYEGRTRPTNRIESRNKQNCMRDEHDDRAHAACSNTTVVIAATATLAFDSMHSIALTML